MADADVPLPAALPADGAPGVEPAAATESALLDDIKRHGENAYYYAHRRNIGPTSIRAYDEPVRDPTLQNLCNLNLYSISHAQPRLLSSTSAAPTGLAAPVVSVGSAAPSGPRQVPVTTYAWGDSGATVKIYVEDLAGLDTIDEGAVQVLQPDATTVELRVIIAGSVHVLRLAPLYMPIASATAKRSAKRVVVTLRKPEDGKTFTWYSLLGDKKKGGVGAGGAAASPLSSAGLGEDFDLSAALGSTTGGLGPDADEDF